MLADVNTFVTIQSYTFHKQHKQGQYNTHTAVSHCALSFSLMSKEVLCATVSNTYCSPNM